MIYNCEGKDCTNCFKYEECETRFIKHSLPILMIPVILSIFFLVCIGIFAISLIFV